GRRSMARPNKGVNHVDGIQGTRESKRRAKLILKTISGEMSVREACEQLGIGPTQFANLRTQALEGFVDCLQPEPAGRRPRAKVVSEHELTLQQRVADLERENRLLRAQAEVAALRRGQEPARSKSVRLPAPRPQAPRADAGGGAVPRARDEAVPRPPAQGADDVAAHGAPGAP
ncbi:MAG TPA: helix-turn-helix domain-containing protein, partial [Polyangiaceae bacterium]